MQPETPLFIPSSGIQLEAVFTLVSPDQGVVITHPHPLYGGSMHNPVVDTIETAYRCSGFSTLVFNFRGVGKSTGTHDNGHAEMTDVLACLGFLDRQGIGERHLAGYSFGSRVNAGIDTAHHNVAGMTMISPPVAFMDYSSVTRIDCPLLVVTGSDDEIAPADRVEASAAQWNPDVCVIRIDQADHFYSGCLDRLFDAIVQGLNR